MPLAVDIFNVDVGFGKLAGKTCLYTIIKGVGAGKAGVIGMKDKHMGDVIGICMVLRKRIYGVQQRKKQNQEGNEEMCASPGRACIRIVPNMFNSHEKIVGFRHFI